MKQNEKLVVPVGYFIFFLMGFYLSMYQYVLLTMCGDLGISEGAIGALSGAQFFAFIILPVLFVFISSKIGTKPLLIGIMLSFLVGTVIVSIANGLAMLLVGVLLLGAGYGGMESQILPQLTEYNPKKSNKYANLCGVFYSLGAVVSPIVASFLMDRGMNWRELFLMLTAMAAILFIMLIFTKTYNIKSEGKIGIKEHAKNPIILLIICAIVMYVGLENATSTYINPYFVKELNKPELSATTLSLFWLAMVPSRFLMSFVKKSRYKIILSCFALLAVCFVLTSIFPSLSMILLIACGFFCGPIWPTLMGIGQDAFPQHKTIVSALLMSATGLGGFLMPLIMSLIDSVSGIKYIYLAISALAFIGLVVYYLEVRILKKRGLDTAL